MIELIRDVISAVLLLAGGFFLIVGAIGLNRMPDVFSRLQATGISDTVGAGFILLGLILQAGFSQVSVKLAFLLLIFLFTAPVATHAVTRAALSVGVTPRLFDESGRRRRVVLEQLGLVKPDKRGTGRAARRSRRATPARKGGKPSKR